MQACTPTHAHAPPQVLDASHAAPSTQPFPRGPSHAALPMQPFPCSPSHATLATYFRAVTRARRAGALLCRAPVWGLIPLKRGGITWKTEGFQWRRSSWKAPHRPHTRVRIHMRVRIHTGARTHHARTHHARTHQACTHHACTQGLVYLARGRAREFTSGMCMRALDDRPHAHAHVRTGDYAWAGCAVSDRGVWRGGPHWLAPLP